MSNRTFYYFYAPTWDYPPSGPIQLGNVITSIKMPEKPLYTVPIPLDPELFSSDKSHVEFSLEKLREGKFSILTKFLSILGIGVNIDVNWDNSNENTFTFDQVKTTQFVPKEDYIQKCIESLAVRRYLDKSRYRKPIYIITGLKIVTGAKAKSHKSHALGGTLGVELNGTIWGGGTVPIGGGSEVEGKKERKEGTSWDASSDFVFAFRVRKIGVKKTGAVKKDEDYRTGAMLGNEIENGDIEELSFEEGDPDVESEGCEGEELIEGDVVVNCAIPKVEDLEENADE